MPTLVVRRPDGTESEHEIAGELKLGRQTGNDLVLTEGGVSRSHARVYVEGGQVFIADEKSANGTFVDGQRIAEPTALTPDSEVIVGDYTLRLKAAAKSNTGARKAVRTGGGDPPPDDAALGGSGPVRATRAVPSLKAKQAAAAAAGGGAIAKRPARPAGAGAPKPASAAPAGTGGGGPHLKGLLGPWAGKTYPLKGKVLVGRQPPAPVILDDDSVSRRHAELEAVGADVTVRDLGSANGTLLNGEPLGTEPVQLQQGDVLQFGVVEMAFEAAEVLNAPTRRGAGASAAPAGAMVGGGGMPANRKKLMMAGGGLVALLLAVGVVKSLTTPDDSNLPPNMGGQGGTAQADPEQTIQDLLSECRSYASSEAGSTPNWARAEETCSKVLDMDPINSEANLLIRKIKLEKESFELFSQGEKLLGRLKPEDALDVFRKISKDSVYYRRARSRMAEATESVEKRAQEDCKLYLRDSQWAAAVPRCQVYMSVWCQKQRTDDLRPPLGFALRLEGRLRKNEWRPKDPLFVKFLIARQKQDPNAAPWECPADQGPIDGPVSPVKAVEEAVKKRFANKFLVEAMMDYWKGRGSEALATLQKLRSNYEAAQFHGQADELLKNMSTVDQLYKAGESGLAADDPERAAEPFREALETDKAVMQELAESKPSFYRRNILQDMADKSYQRGKHWADREDKRRGCRIWKLGFSFYAGNPDLNKAAGFCSGLALQALRGAGGCPDLPAVLDYAVKGDGIAEQVEAKKQEWKCQ